MFSGYNLDMRISALFALIVLIGLNACAGGTATLVPSPLPTGTSVLAIVPSPSMAPSNLEASSPTPAVVSTPTEIPSTPEPTITETPLTPTLLSTLPLPTETTAATDIPQPAVDSGAIQFLGPGPFSELVSPFYIYGYAIPGYNHTGTIALYGEDGRVLASQLLQLNTAYNWAYFSWPLSFQVEGAGELGRLTMSTHDEYGRLIAVYSVHLLLLPEGNSIVTPPGDLKERCVIDHPVQGKWLSGGTLLVTGAMRPFNNLPIVVELIGRDGKLIASQLEAISPAADNSYVPFQVNVPYTISTGTWARLSVSQPDDRISGLMYLYSREVFLHP